MLSNLDSIIILTGSPEASEEGPDGDAPRRQGRRGRGPRDPRRVREAAEAGMATSVEFV